MDCRPFHIVPEDDIREHRLGLDCECRPNLIPEDSTHYAVIIHNAWDGREEWEWPGLNVDLEALTKES